VLAEIVGDANHEQVCRSADRRPDTGNFARIEAPTRIGMSNTTIGVLFMKALKIAPAINVSSKARTGRVDQARLTTFASG